MPTQEQLRLTEAVLHQEIRDRPAATSQNGPEESSERIVSTTRTPRRSYPRPRDADIRILAREEVHRLYSVELCAPYAQREDFASVPQGPVNRLPPPEHRSLPPIVQPPLCSAEEPQQAIRSQHHVREDLESDPTPASPRSSVTLKGGKDEHGDCRHVEKERSQEEPPEPHLIDDWHPIGVLSLDHSIRVQTTGELRKLEQEWRFDSQGKPKGLLKTKPQRWESELPDWMRTLLRLRKYTAPYYNNYFVKDFNFGPKRERTHESDELPLSPRSSHNSVPKGVLEGQCKVSKHQRHDSSHV